MTDKFIKMVCDKCGSEDVLADAYVCWDVAAQTWEVASTFDKGAYCNQCDGEARLKEVELTGANAWRARAHKLAIEDGWLPSDEDGAMEYCNAHKLDYRRGNQ
jgi:hypothetical protein